MISNFSLSKKLLIGFIAVYMIRFFISITMGIMPQDAYYYLYSENLALSYFDHPPMVAYMLKLTKILFGQSVIVVKLTDFTISFLSFASFYYLSAFFLSKRRAFYAALLYGSTLQLTVLSINTTPDVPLLLFWTITLIVLYKALTQGKLHLWALSGILIGLSFSSKYTGLFLLLGLFLFLLMSKKYRHLLFSKKIFIALFFFLLIISPIIYWNFENEWVSFAFQTKERVSLAGQISLRPKFFLGNLGTQLLLLIPFLFCGIVLIFYKNAKKIISKKAFLDDKMNFLIAFSLPVIAFFFFISLFYWVKLNWTMPGYITAIILASIYFPKKILSYQIITSLLIHILLLVQIKYYVFSTKSDDTWFGWEQLADRVKLLKEKDPDCFVFSADGYKTSAVLNFYLNDHVYGSNIIDENGLQFSIIDSELDHLESMDAYYIDSDNNFENLSKSNEVPSKLKNYFGQITELEPIIIKDNRTRPIRKFLVYKCYGYINKSDH